MLSQERHSCNAAERFRERLGGKRHSSSSTVQYASLRNLDQLSIRTPCRAYNGRHVGRIGAFFSGMCASVGVRSAFRLLHSRQASTQFSHVLVPPRDRGNT